MILYECDLCGQIRGCSQRVIEQTEYDVCAECWIALEKKLSGKGRRKKGRETVTVPAPAIPERLDEKRESFPGQPPEIVADSGRLN